ncbi:MAG: M20/M25/M40 family metallo-hydrolase, partial [Candidatus Rifleibacteriota bacterium]
LAEYPPTVNDPDCWKTARQTAADLLGETAIVSEDPAMGAEDFAFYQLKIPGCFAFLGVKDPGAKESFGLHHPRFQPDESALALGTAWHVATSLQALADLKK